MTDQLSENGWWLLSIDYPTPGSRRVLYAKRIEDGWALMQDVSHKDGGYSHSVSEIPSDHPSAALIEAKLSKPKEEE